MSAEIENGHAVEKDDHLETETGGGNLDPDREIEREVVEVIHPEMTDAMIANQLESHTSIGMCHLLAMNT